MSKGAEKHHARLSQLNSFGKDLARRSKSHCELCAAHGVKLFIHEVPPVPHEPELDFCIFICETCLKQIEQPKHLDINHWHCLHTSIWSSIPAVQVMAVVMANRIKDKAEFAGELLEQIYLEENIKNWVDTAL